mmetsp:Transcript_1872/g.2887  ORF Transcript_1872/g.2887 Transcript_1872/m.2887 type:complete len:321 (+) Transcript_1872:84-1046(+)
MQQPEQGLEVFEMTLSCDTILFSHLIGQNGVAKESLEQATGAQVLFDALDVQAKSIIIRSSTRHAVEQAYDKLQALMKSLLSSRRILDYNYFLSLPLANPCTIQHMHDFQQAVMANPPEGMDDSVFSKGQHLHLTLSMLKLYSEESRSKARLTLQSLSASIHQLLGNQPLVVRLKGLATFQELDPRSAHVLYMKVQEVGKGDRLFQLQKLLVAAFREAGLLLPRDNRLNKLHVTVVNTKYRRSPPDTASCASTASDVRSQERGDRARIPIDASSLLKQKLNWGKVVLPAIHISERGRFDLDTGFYACLHSVELPAFPQSQ